MGPTITPLMGIKQVVNYVAQLDGATQYWQLSDGIPADSNEAFSFSVQVNFGADFSGVNTVLADGANGEGLWVYIENGSKVGIRLNGSEFKTFQFGGNVNGVLKVSFDSNNIVVENGGVTLTAINSLTTNLNVLRLGFRGTFGYFKGVLSDFYFFGQSGELISYIPLTNKAQGATQLATVGNVNATMIGYNENVWVKESDL